MKYTVDDILVAANLRSKLSEAGRNHEVIVEG
jgi:hypothetical protein